MKTRILLFSLLLFGITTSAQIYDTAVLRNYINANIVPNSARQITGTQVNNIFNGFINTVEQTTSAQVAGLSDLMALSTRSGSAIVKDPRAGGIFVMKNTGVVDSIIVFPATNGKYWVRQWDGSTINAAWAGIKGDGSDESWLLNKIISTFSIATVSDTPGIAIRLPKGTYRFKNINVKRGIKIYADQNARNNVAAYVPVKIFPAPGASYIFDFTDTTMNACLQSLYIDGDYMNVPNLVAAVRFRGTFNTLEDNNIINCANYAVWSTCGAFRIVHNNLQGNRAPNIPFASSEDFHGTLHIIAAGDSYLKDNEIGANAPYLTGQVPTPIQILRDPVYKRIVSLYAGYLGNSYVENNLFENADQGAVVNGGIYANYKGNRYEMNAFRGMRLRNMYYSTFTDEKFANNSLAIDGGGEDLRLDTGAVAFCRWTKPTFIKMPHPAIPTSTFKVKYNVVNYSGKENYMDGPVFVIPSLAGWAAKYDSLGHYDNTIQALPFRYAFYQTDPQNAIFNSVRAGWTGSEDDSVRGGVEMVTGTLLSQANRTGILRWFRTNNVPTAQVGFDNTDDLTFSLFNTSGTGRYIFGNGEAVLAKNGASGLSIQSNDGTGDAHINMYSDPSFTYQAGMSLSHTTGAFNFLSSNGFGYNSVNPGTFVTTNMGLTFAKAGGIPMVMIGDNTGNHQIHMSSDGLATRFADITFNNATGDLSITGSRDILLGASHNLTLKQNGLTYIPTTPTPITTGFDFLARNSTTGEMTIRSNVYWDSTTTKNYIAAQAGTTPTPTLNAVTTAGNSTGNLINVGGIGSSGPAVFGGGIFPSMQVVAGSTSLSVGGYTTTLVNNTGTATLSLPSAASAANQIYFIKKVSAAGNDVIIDPNASETIDSATTKTLTLQNSSVLIQSNGTSWFILSSHAAATTL